VNAKPRVGAMIDARRVDSATKRSRLLAVVEQMVEQGESITFASVARKAGVSTWLAYAPGVREVIEHGRARQDSPTRAGHTTASETPGLATDLALARAEIVRLRAERDTQHRQLQLAIGARMDNLAKADLVARVDELTRHNTQLAAALAHHQAEVTALKARVVELEDDLTAAPTGLRRMIRAENRPVAVTRPQGERP
jgi:hypothetical protein